MFLNTDVSMIELWNDYKYKLTAMLANVSNESICVYRAFVPSVT